MSSIVESLYRLANITETIHEKKLLCIKGIVCNVNKAPKGKFNGFEELKRLQISEPEILDSTNLCVIYSCLYIIDGQCDSITHQEVINSAEKNYGASNISSFAIYSNEADQDFPSLCGKEDIRAMLLPYAEKIFKA